MIDADAMPERASRAFESHGRFASADGGYALTTTDFDSRVTATTTETATPTASAGETDESAIRYTVTVRVPMLSAAVRESVGPSVEEGWFETLSLRLEDAAAATRNEVAIDQYALERDGTAAVARYVFEWDNADTAPDLAKAIIEFVEGTYLQGVVPGYEYRDPVAGMLARARQDDAGDGDGDGDRGDTGGPMPL